jgi:hypothetical protein
LTEGDNGTIIELMDIEELSKSQLILLTILVNFVVSIATGILTVSLLDQAPPVVTQTINRVVEHTIEKVGEAAPAVIAPSPAPSTQDLVTGAIAADAARTVALFDARTGTSSPALALGTYLPTARAIVTASNGTLPTEVLVQFASGAHVAASRAREGSGLVVYGFSDTAVLPQAAKPALIPAKDLKLGQTALALTNEGAAVTGIVSKVNDAGIHTTLPYLGSGSAVVDLAGNIIGITPSGGVAGVLINAEEITKLLSPSPAASN